ncbi:MAG: DHH family phosphoesterase [Candidatus Helarchaeota archaeon]|nr:DHH family phosphoesterase [Candidatus Helarchaeota archaeon]
MGEHPEFFNLINRTADEIQGWIQDNEIIRVASHLDADGLSAGGIISQALYREGGKFHLRIIRQLEKSFIKELADEKRKYYIFIDMGTGQINTLEEYLADNKVIIIDHHKPLNENKSQFLHVNPHFFGIDGVTEISGAGIAYFVAKAMNEQNTDLANLAVVGGIGDRQDKGKYFSLSGLNELIIKDGTNAGILKEERDLRFFGKESRPIHLSLKYTTEPFIPGISGNEENCIRILMSAGIKPKENKKWRTISDLSQDEKVKLNSAIVKFALKKGFDRKEALNLIGTSYTFLNEEKGSVLRDAREFSSLLNACGRMSKGGLGISICMGDKDSFEEALKSLTEYRKKIAEYLNWFQEKDIVQEKKAIYHFHGGKKIIDKMIGTITSIATSSNLIKSDKPLIGIAYIADAENLSKISARGFPELIEKGLDLGKALRDTIKKLKIEGEAGGHNIAAGAQIPTDLENKFLETLDTIIEKQILNKNRNL